MLYTFIAFAAAALTGMAAHALLGLQGLLTSGWVDPLFWAIILTGVALDHGASLIAWFNHQRPMVQNLAAAVGFLLIAAGLMVLLQESSWTWHIEG
jgi:hypothetical protein